MRTLSLRRLGVLRPTGRIALFAAIAVLSHSFIAHSSIFTDRSSVLTDPSSVTIDRGSGQPLESARDRSAPPSTSAPAARILPPDADAPRLDGPGFASPALGFDVAIGLPCPTTVPPPLQ